MSGIKFQTFPSGAKIYHLSAGKSSLEWRTEALKSRDSLKQLRKNVQYQKRFEILQDLHFPTHCAMTKASPDGQHLMAIGGYSPSFKVYDTSNLALKYERNIDSDALTFEFLSDDGTKSAILRRDRFIEFHSIKKMIQKVRVPYYGRDMLLNKANSDLYISCTGNSEIYRMNLAKGQFLKPLDLHKASKKLSGTNDLEIDGVNCMAQAPKHYLLTCGTPNGDIICFNPRTRKCVATFNPSKQSPLISSDSEITSIDFHSDGLHCAIGNSNGQVAVYDIRMWGPTRIKDHKYGLGINTIRYHGQSNLICSSDSQIIKIWNQNTGVNLMSFELDAPIEHFDIVDDSGLIFVSAKTPRIHSLYAPSLGVAPRWCSFLDKLIDEVDEESEKLDESKSSFGTIFDDYRFVTTKELERLNLSHLIGTDHLRPYVHGYFMHLDLYQKAFASVNTTDFEEFRLAQIQKKIDDMRQSRIVSSSSDSKLTATVNTDLADTRPELIQDDRFASLFTDPKFSIDSSHPDFKSLDENSAAPPRYTKPIIQEEPFEFGISSDDEAEEPEFM